MKLEPGNVLAGRYCAEAPLGRGGMGEVWRCVDLEQDKRVAVKVVRDAVHDADAARMFRDEVLATAHLRHPAIVVVYDVVQVSDDLALVMELVAGTPLSSRVGQPFSTLRPILRHVLEALAHAHARGVLHLDLKPGNVVVSDGALGPTATLLDFGIARAWHGGPSIAPRDDLVQGTLPYMAPEQIVPGLAALGPWTDLFAFAAMTHHLVTGRHLFGRGDAAARMLAAPPTLDAARHGAPPGLAALLSSLLNVQARERPTHAADVIAALDALPETPAERAAPSPAAFDDQATIRDALPATHTSTPTSPLLLPPPPPPATPPTAVVEDHQRSEAGTHALVGLKEPPLRGRSDARARIWQQLVALRSDGNARVIAITGAMGTGKSRLARSALEDAHQHGLAHTAWTSWSDSGAGNEGVRALLDNVMMTEGYAGEALYARVEGWAERFPGRDDPRFVREATRVLDGASPTAVDPDLALRVTTEALRRAAARRAVVVWLDDVHASQGAAEPLVERLRAEPRVAVIATSIQAQVEAPDLHLTLGPLSAAEARALVQDVLDVDAGLLEAIEQRSLGNPLLATQLAAELVGNEAIERRAGKYAPRADYDLQSLPRNLDALWEARIARSGADPVLLGAVALTRPRVSDIVLDALTDELGAAVRESAERAMRAGLAVRRGGALSWVHASLRSHLSARLSPDVRRGLHAAAARALACRVGSEDVQHERAAHLHGADDVEAACRAMTEAIAWSHLRADERARCRRAETLLAWATEADLPAHRARALAELAHASANAGERDRARALVEEAIALERATATPSAWVSWRAAQVARLDNDAARAHDLSLKALELAQREANREVESHVTGQLGLDAHRRRDVATARACFQRAVDLARARGDLGTEARALLHLGNLAPVESLALFDRAVTIAREAADSRTELSTMQVRADALFQLGDRGRATAEMREVAERARSLGFRPLIGIVEIQLACWALWNDDATTARAHVTAAEAAGTREGSVVARCMTAALAAAVAAIHGDTAGAQRELSLLAAARGSYDEDELRRVLQVGARHARGALAQAFASAGAPMSTP